MIKFIAGLALIAVTTIVGEPKAPGPVQLPAQMNLHEMIATLCAPTPDAHVFIGMGHGMFSVIPCKVIIEGPKQTIQFLEECKDTHPHNCVGYSI